MREGGAIGPRPRNQRSARQPPAGGTPSVVRAPACRSTRRRHHPLNLVALLAFTLCQSALLGTLSAVLDTPVALVAGGLSAGVVLALSLFAMQNR